jgi:hypothetical protein
MSKQKKQSILDMVKEINDREALEKQERFEKKNNLAREKYGLKNAEDKKEILKVRQGISEDSVIFADIGKKENYTVVEKIKNFFYHNMWWLGITTFIVLIAAFLTYDTLTTIHSDVRVMLLTDDNELQNASPQLHEYFNKHVIDYNDDDRQYTDIVSIPISRNMEDNYKSVVGYENSLTNLSTQFQLCESMIILADSAVDELIEPETTLENLEEFFPNCPYVKGCKIMLKDSNFAELIGINNEDIPDDLYLAVRTPIELLSDKETCETNYQNAMATVKSVVKELE